MYSLRLKISNLIFLLDIFRVNMVRVNMAEFVKLSLVTAKYMERNEVSLEWNHVGPQTDRGGTRGLMTL